MSGLAGILTGRHEPGVFLWHAAFDAAEVQHTVEHAGWRFGYVDGWVHQDKPAVLTAIGAALAFPDYYGTNLDALVDCLGDLTDQHVLLWDGWSTLARSDEKAFANILEILGGHASVVTTLLRGEGPDLDVPSLD